MSNTKEETRGKNTFRPQFKALLTIPSTKEVEDPIFAKSQMLFWTILTIVIFFFKTTIDGILWDVPEELVILMGISQGGFLVRKQMAVKEKVKEVNEKKKELEKAFRRAMKRVDG